MMACFALQSFQDASGSAARTLGAMTSANVTSRNERDFLILMIPPSRFGFTCHRRGCLPPASEAPFRCRTIRPLGWAGIPWDDTHALHRRSRSQCLAICQKNAAGDLNLERLYRQRTGSSLPCPSSQFENEVADSLRSALGITDTIRGVRSLVPARSTNFLDQLSSRITSIPASERFPDQSDVFQSPSQPQRHVGQSVGGRQNAYVVAADPISPRTCGRGGCFRRRRRV
jgi:hypothetical protein